MAKVVVVMAGLSIACLGLLAGLLYSVSPVLTGEGVDLLTSTVAASFIVLGLGLGLPLAWQGVNSLRGLPSRLFHPRPAGLLVVIFIIVMLLGQAVLAFDLAPALTFPPFYILAAALPPLFFVAAVGRILAGEGIRWREVVLQLSSGAFLATFASFGLEAVSGLVLMVIAFALAAMMPGGEAWVQDLSAYLQDPRWLQNPESLYGPLLSPPILVAVGLLVLVIAPMIEELFKPLGVLLMRSRRPFDRAQDRPSKARSFLWGLAGGAGFALSEALFNGTASLETWSGVATMRVGATAMHCLGGGLMGLGWYYLFATRRPWRLLGAYAASVTLHSLWNVAASIILVVSLSAVSPPTDEIGLAFGGLVTLGLMAFLSLLSLISISVIFYLARWLQAEMLSEESMRLQLEPSVE
jgi:hypothetical protein